MNTYTFFWRGSPKPEILRGNDPAHALNRAGYGQGAVAALDFYAEGKNTDYEWNENEWKRRE